ncbi:hypothetical protein [Frigoriflavimonas asaccharolytica]|uniref:Uncharacterized protein n=1 Tax=Frigoriflavimonas asaccharolytica TaxID=2735899 RepID=A0A8J8K8A1_9FLAO|nr:hypothetical protein [Frigoriflavimonas asaccharolytica]NRS91742.1 hypothetical protein [Frigoriflavimonas asaccharolytica]
MNFQEAVSNAKNSTRIAVFAPKIFADCLQHCLNFHQVTFSFFSDENQNVFATDFQIFHTENPEEFNLIKPNIALIIPQSEAEFAKLNLGEIINGGVLIYNEDLEHQISETPGFFRKLSFQIAETTTDNFQNFLETDFSQIPLQISDRTLIENIFGLKILCQQTQIMEEDFYEALMEFRA